MEFNKLKDMLYVEYKTSGYEARWNSCPDKSMADLAELCLIAGEACGEAAEAIRDADYEHLAEELADVIIRTMNMATRLHIDIERVIIEKHHVNMTRGQLHGRKL